jgi:hypothetical protein
MEIILIIRFLNPIERINIVFVIKEPKGIIFRKIFINYKKIGLLLIKQ